MQVTGVKGGSAMVRYVVTSNGVMVVDKVCMHICMCICKRESILCSYLILMCVCVHIYIYMCVCVCMYVCMYVCM